MSVASLGRTMVPASVLVILLVHSGCTVEDERLGVAQQALNPFTPVEGVGIDESTVLESIFSPAVGERVPSWRVPHDNPRVGSVYEMPFTNDPNVFLASVRDKASWVYDFFDITASFDDAGGGDFMSPPINAYREGIYAWPSKHGLVQGEGNSLSWEVHGLRLDPLGTAAKIDPWEDDWQNPNVKWSGSEGFVHLDPAVKVVPVVTIVAWGDERPPIVPGLCPYPKLDADRIEEGDTRAFWDDDWTGQKTTYTSPGYHPEQVVASWEYKAGCNDSTVCKSAFTANVSDDGAFVDGGKFYQPDRRYDICGVQFREIAHIKCNVPADVLHPSPFECPSGLQALADAKKVRDYVKHNCLPERDSDAFSAFIDPLKVVFMGQFSMNCPGKKCVEETLGGNVDEWVFITHRAPRGTIAHEIGHALGLGHMCPEPENLMCAQPHGSLQKMHTLTSEQCADVYTNAASVHDSYW